MEIRDEPANSPADTRPGAVAGNGKSLDRYLGNAIRELRLKDNLTIAEVAAQAGISRGMVSKIENGGRWLTPPAALESPRRGSLRRAAPGTRRVAVATNPS